MNAHTPFHLAEAQPSFSFVMPSDTTFDEWRDFGRKLCLAGRGINWMIGDWLIAGTDKWGDKARDEANRIFHLDAPRLDPILKVCRRFPEPERHRKLAFGHYLAVAKIDDNEATRLLDEAATNRTSVADLKATISAEQEKRQPRFNDDTIADREYRRIIQAWNEASTLEARELAAESIAESGYGIIAL